MTDETKENTIEVTKYGEDPKWRKEQDFKITDKRLQSNDKKIQKYEPDPFLSMVERLAKIPDVDTAKLREIMDMQERILDRNAKQAFNEAMTKAQNRIELVVARSKNEQTHSMYANLKQILIETKPIYTEEGFSLMFYEGETTKENHTRVCVDIMHKQGHTEKRWGDFAVQTTGIAGKAMMTLIHGQGSTFSYGRRYLTCLIFNIPTGDDDDGNKAGGKIDEYINEKQLSTIVDMIQAKEVDQTKFCQWLKVDAPENILAKDFNKALNALKAKK